MITVMDWLIELIRNRIYELQCLIALAQSNGKYGDVKWLKTLLIVNQDILFCLSNDMPISFSKIPELEKTKPYRLSAFLTHAEVTAPFIENEN